MFTFFFSDSNFIYGLFLSFSIVLTLIESIAFFTGFSFLFSNDHSATDLPESGLEGTSIWFSLFHWLKIGKIPLLASIILFSTFFGVSGLALNAILTKLLDFSVHWKWTLFPASVVSLGLHRVVATFFHHFLFKEETSAISEDSFLGRSAEIVIGTAKKGVPAQAKLKDEYGRLHYIMIEPFDESEQFQQGEKVEICDLQKKGSRRLFFANRPTSLLN